jgi:flavodoxin
MKKILVAYFSASGVTRRAAQALAEAASADVYEIRPAVPYTKADLNWMDKNSRSSVEMDHPESRPEIAGRVENMAQYDLILLGFPIWWHVAPTIINTFLDSYDFSGKKVVLFATSGGSGFGATAERLKSSVSDTTILQAGRLLNGKPSAHDLRAWVEELKK